MGPVASSTALTRATQARVWRVSLQGAPDVVVKQPHSAASFAREAEAYRTWARASRFIPQVHAILDPPVGAFILEWVDSVPATDSTLPADVVRTMHAEAGRFCRALASTPCAVDDPMPLAEALATRMHHWCVRGANLVPAATLQAAAARFDPSLFDGQSRVFAHRDLSPWNWLVVRDPEPRLVVIDFGHARADAPLTDLLKLWDVPWEETPGARAAFMDGFGHNLTDEETARLHQLALLHGVASAVWGREHDAAQYAAIGLAVLERLL